MPTTRRRSHTQHTPENPKIIPARYEGKCSLTGQRFEAGEMIISRGRGWEKYSATQATTSQPSNTPGPQESTRPPVFGLEKRHFGSVAEYIAAVEKAQPHPVHTVRHARDIGSGWQGTKSMEEALHFARCGWRAGIKHIEEAREKLPLLAIPPENEAEYYFDVSGDILDVARSIEGDREAFLNFQSSPGEGKILKIVVDVSFSAGWSAAEITNRGAQICALVEALEIQGYSVELTAHDRTTISKGRAEALEVRALIKEAGQPLELDRAAFFLTNSAVGRRLNLALMEERHDCTEGYGTPDHNRPADLTDDTIFLPVSFDIDAEPLPIFRAAGLIA